MRWIGDVWFRIRTLLTRSTMERELDEELRYHLERETEKNVAAGMSEAEALRAARIAFGGEDRHREETRASWGVTWLTDLSGDLRFARRQLLKNPSFSALAVLTLALGIGGTIALSSIVHALMVRPLPVEDEARVVTWWSSYNWRGAEFDYIREVPQAFESLAAFSNDGYTLRTEAGASMVLATVVSAELFDVLRAPPLLGRTFRPGEDRPGAEPVVVLGHALWAQEFGRDPDIVGRRLSLGGTLRTVVGVMPADFYFPTPEYDLFVPLDLDPADPSYAGNGWLNIIGRLGPDVGEVQIADDLRRVTTALDAEYDYPDAWDKTRSPYVTPLREYIFGETRTALLVLLGAVGTVLLMACVNVAALLLTKTVDRTREVAVRAALGAGRARLARQVLTESVLLGAVAGGVGVLLAVALFDVLVASVPVDPSFRSTLALDWTALGSALVLAVVSGSAIAIAPMRSLLRGDLSEVSFADRSGGAGARAGRMQNTLVVAEVLLAVVLVTGASLLMRTVGELRAVELGFEPDGLLALTVLLSEDEVPPEERAAFHDELLRRASALPGVDAITLTNRLPLRDGGYQGPVRIEGRPDLDGAARPNAMYRTLTPGGLQTFGAELVQGRGILPSDVADGPTVAVVNETFARRIWGEESPLDRTFHSGFFSGPIEVVGVVRDMAVSDLVGVQPMAAYYPWAQSDRASAHANLVVRSSGDPALLAGPLRALIREIESDAAIDRVMTVQEAIRAEMADALRLRFFLGLFSLIGIVLGGVGVYGVVSYSVERRQPEFGIRLALGADPRKLLGRVLRSGMVPVAVGVVGGTVVALFASRLLAAFLFGVEPFDPVSVGVAAGVLLTAGIAASAIPAARASSTPPAVALRAD